jgi:transposase
LIVLPASVRIVALTTPVTFQRDVDSLVRCVREVLEEDPFSGDVFCFLNPRRDRVKLLVWDRNGFWVLSTRLERGRFRRLEGREKRTELTREELIMLFGRLDTKTDRILRNFERDGRRSGRGDDDRPARAADGSASAPSTPAR